MASTMYCVSERPTYGMARVLALAALLIPLVGGGGCVLNVGNNCYDLVLNGNELFDGCPPPSAPSELRAEASKVSVEITWNVVSDATEYYIYRHTKANRTPIRLSVGKPITNTTYTDSEDLEREAVYIYTILAVSSVGESKGQTVTIALIPDSPTGLTAINENSQVKLKWNSAIGAAEYRIYRSVAGGVFTRIDPTNPAVITKTTYTDTDATNGTTYTYRVRAANAGGESVDDNDDNMRSTTLLPDIPDTTTNLTATAGDTQITLTWNRVDDADEYRIYRSISGGAPALIDPTTPAVITTFVYTDRGLSNGTTYTYTVRAVNAGGESGTSNIERVIPISGLPNAPSNLSATIGNAQVTLNWNSVTSATEYRIYRSIEGGVFTRIDPTNPAVIINTTYTDTDATNGTTYTYTVRTVNGANESGNSNPITAKPFSTFTLLHAAFVSHHATN